MTVSPPACLNCKHWLPDASPPACTAYPPPRRIPNLIWIDGDPHTLPVAGDGGIRFEPVPSPLPTAR